MRQQEGQIALQQRAQELQFKQREHEMALQHKKEMDAVQLQSQLLKNFNKPAAKSPKSKGD
jgi:hypothetical protein